MKYQIPRVVLSNYAYQSEKVIRYFINVFASSVKNDSLMRQKKVLSSALCIGLMNKTTISLRILCDPANTQSTFSSSLATESSKK